MGNTHAEEDGFGTHGRDAEPRSAILGAEDLLFLERLDHDLRTPLGTMATVLDLLRGDTPTASQANAIAVLERQVARLHSLTASLHDFSQRLGR